MRNGFLTDHGATQARDTFAGHSGTFGDQARFSAGDCRQHQRNPTGFENRQTQNGSTRAPPRNALSPADVVFRYRKRDDLHGRNHLFVFDTGERL